MGCREFSGPSTERSKAKRRQYRTIFDMRKLTSLAGLFKLDKLCSFVGRNEISGSVSKYIWRVEDWWIGR